MSDRRISLNGSAVTLAENSQTIRRKGPSRATAARFLPIDQRRGMYKAFHEGGRSVEQIAAMSRVPRLLVQDVLRTGRDEEIGRRRQLDLLRRVA